VRHSRSDQRPKATNKTAVVVSDFPRYDVRVDSCVARKGIIVSEVPGIISCEIRYNRQQFLACSEKLLYSQPNLAH